MLIFVRIATGGTDGGLSLQGAIEELGLCELIQALSLNRYRGTLRIEPDGAASQFFYLHEGEIVLLRTVESEPVRIGELLLRAGLVKAEQLNDALKLQKQTTYRRLGDTLVSLGYVDPKAIDRVVHLRFEEEFLDIFLLDRGRFEFIFGLTPEALFPAETVERIALNTSSLMLEAMRRVDEWHALLQRLGSLDEIFEKTQPDVALAPNEQAISRLTATQRTAAIGLLDGRRNLREVLGAIQAEGCSRLAALHFLDEIERKGAIRALGQETLVGRLAEALASNDVDGTAKLIRCLLAKGPINVDLVGQYVDFLRRSGRPSFARQECKILGGHYLNQGAVDDAITLYQRALEIDPRDTEVIDRLFYALLRKSDVERALALAGPLRDAVARERDLGTVSRIVKNMKELAPQDVRVLELSGLVAKRQERLEEAKIELARALEAADNAGADDAKKSAILQALVEVDPSLKVPSSATVRVKPPDTARSLPTPAGVAPRAPSRAPWVAVLLLAIAAPFAVEELRAREELERARPLETAIDARDRMAALALYETASARLCSVRGEARALADALAQELGGKLAAAKAPVAPTPTEPAGPPTPVIGDTELSDYDAARRRGNWPLVAKVARRLHDSKDKRAERVRMPVKIITAHEGAVVTWEGGEGRTPCVLELPVDKKIELKLRKVGFAPAQVTVTADEYREVTVELIRGVLWQQPVAGSVVALAAAPGVAVVLTRPATLHALSLQDGAVAWERSVEGEGDLGPPGFVQGRILASARSGALVAFGPDGAELPRIQTKHALFAPQAAPVSDGERTLLATAESLVLADAEAGTVVREIALPAPPVAPSALKTNRAWTLLANGTVVAADLANGTLLWTADPKVQVSGGPILVGSVLYLAARDGTLLALNLSNGSTAWRRGPKQPAPTDHGAAADDTRIVTASATRVVSFEGKEGKPLWEQSLSVCGPVLRVTGRLYAPTSNGEVLELGSADGRTLARYPFDGSFIGFATAPKFLLVASGHTISAIERTE